MLKFKIPNGIQKQILISYACINTWNSQKYVDSTCVCVLCMFAQVHMRIIENVRVGTIVPLFFSLSRARIRAICPLCVCVHMWIHFCFVYATILSKENSSSFMLRSFFSLFFRLLYICCHCVAMHAESRVVVEVSQSLFRSTLRYLWSLTPLHVAMWLRSILVKGPLFALCSIYMRPARQPKWLMQRKQWQFGWIRK